MRRGKFAIIILARETEKHIQELLKERNGELVFSDAVAEKVAGSGREAPPDDGAQSPEMYVGYRRAE